MTAKHDTQYLNLLKDVFDNGVRRTDRTGTGTVSVFHRTMEFDLSDGTIPLLTTKKIHIPSILTELLWYISGDGNIRYLQENGVRIWNEWADDNGDLGPVYGVQWRKTPKVTGAHIDYSGDPPKAVLDVQFIDQLQQVIDKIKNKPHDRRLLVSAWNVAYLDEMKLPPCHYAFQFYVEHDNRLSCKLHQRSADLFLGVPFNIAQYSILVNMIAHVTDLQPGRFIWDGGDVHIYLDHFSQVSEQLIREPFESPTLRFNRQVTNIDDFNYEDFVIENYQHHPAIKAKVSV